MHLYGHDVKLNSKPNISQYSLVEETFFYDEYLTFKINLYNNQYREVSILSDKPFDNIQKNQTISFIVKDVLVFTSNLNQKEILLYRDKECTDDLVKYWLYHTFFPILLTFENRYYFLHSAGVEIENKPVFFIADSFGGKSTLTDFFIKKGHTMISDDKVATYEKDEKIYSIPSYSYHRPYRKMEDLGILVENFSKENKSICAIFNLVKVDKDSDISINKIIGIEKFKALKYATDIDLPIHKKSRFKALTNIANKTDIYNITIPWDLNRLEEVYQAIIEFIKQKEN